MAAIRELLARSGKKQCDLAERLGLPASRISEMIAGRRKLQVHEVRPAAEFMRVPVEALLPDAKPRRRAA